MAALFYRCDQGGHYRPAHVTGESNDDVHANRSTIMGMTLALKRRGVAARWRQDRVTASIRPARDLHEIAG